MNWTHCPECKNPHSNSPRYGHCAACHQTFMGIYTWDAHRRDGECLDPETEPKERQWWQDAKGYWHRGERDTRFTNRKAPK